MKDLDSLVKTICELATESKYSDMCFLLKKHFEDNMQHVELTDVITIEGQFNLVERQFSLGVLSEETFLRGSAQTRLALLEIVNRMRDNKLPSFVPGEAHQRCEAICAMLDVSCVDYCISLLKKLLRQFPKFPRALILMGVAQGLSGHPRSAIRYFKDAQSLLIENDPYQVEILVNLGTAYLLHGSPKKALLYWQMAEALGSDVAAQWKKYFISFTNKTNV
ncbi:MAG: hypothetical protein ACKV1O_19685 [Saprospiraceae bacterium]